MNPVIWLVNMIIRPRRTAQTLIQEGRLSSALSLVLGFGMVLALLFLGSHLRGDYPPPPDEFQVWIEIWGEFAMLPFLKIPPEQYRLAQAVFIIPLVLGVWILMAGSARMFSILFGGRGAFEQYLTLFGFSFFAFWILGSLLDMGVSLLLGDFVIEALRQEHGPLIKSMVAAYPPLIWTTLLGIGGIYNGIVTHVLERFSLWKTVLISLVAFLWSIVLITCLIR
jgi:hypothetical protein